MLVVRDQGKGKEGGTVAAISASVVTFTTAPGFGALKVLHLSVLGTNSISEGK